MIFFIKRPVLAIVLNCMIVFVGLISLRTIEIREYPRITLPVIAVRAFYPNASAAMIESDITNPLEEGLAEVPGLDYMTSEIQHGSTRTILVLKSGVSIDKTMTYVRDSVSKVRDVLPKDVKEPVIERLDKKPDGPTFMILSVISADKTAQDLMHFTNVVIKNSLRSVEGIAFVDPMGSPYMLKITLDTKALHQYGINADDVFLALKEQQVSLPAGKFQNEIPVTFDLKMRNIADFQELLIKDVPLKDLAKIVRTGDDNSDVVTINGKPGVLLFLGLTSDANQLKTSDDVHAALKRLNLPEDVSVKIISDQADFIRQSLTNIRSAIYEACALIPFMIFLFLGSFRSALVPLVTIPVSLIGTFFVLKFFGFSLNVITLLVLVLAIGMVVDNAIVVLENIDRHIKKGLSPLRAAIKGSSEVSFAIIAMTFTLASVFLPIAFIQDVSGQLFVEFAVALSTAIIISGLTALTLSPLMCVHLFTKTKHTAWIDQFLPSIFSAYKDTLAIIPKKHVLYGSGAILTSIVVFGFFLPKEMVTPEDRGLVGVYIPSEEQNRKKNTDNVNLVDKAIGNIRESAERITMSGLWGSNMIFQLKPYEKRRKSAAQIVNQLKDSTQNIPSVDVFPWSWDSGLPGYGGNNSQEINFVLKTMDSYEALFKEAEKTQKALNTKFQGTHHDLNLDAAAYEIVLDRLKLAQTKLSPLQISQTVQVYFGGLELYEYFQDMIRYPIRIVGSNALWSLDEIYMTTAAGVRVPIGQFATLKHTALPTTLQHHNQMRSVEMSVPYKGSIASAMSRVKSLLKGENDKHHCF